MQKEKEYCKKCMKLKERKKYFSRVNICKNCGEPVEENE